MRMFTLLLAYFMDVSVISIDRREVALMTAHLHDTPRRALQQRAVEG